MTAPTMMLASSCAASWTRDDASLTSKRVISEPPVMLISTPRAPSIDRSSRSGLEIAAAAASTARVSPAPMPVPMSATPASFITVRTSAKSRLIRPWIVIRSEMPRTALSRTWSAMLNASFMAVPLPARDEEALVRNRDQRVDDAVQFLEAVACVLHPHATLERERLGHHADREGADFARDLGDDRSGPGSGSTAHPRGHEDHVGAFEQLAQPVAGFERRGATAIRIGAAAEAARDLRAELDLAHRFVVGQRLGIGIGGDELDASEARLDHGVECVAAAPTDTDHLDDGFLMRGTLELEQFLTVFRSQLEQVHALFFGVGGFRAIVLLLSHAFTPRRCLAAPQNVTRNSCVLCWFERRG